MAKYEVKMSCGHTETIQLYGKEADRERKIAYLEENGECAECYKARLAAKRMAETAAATAQARKENMPSLTGSAKQISWALTIRAEKLAELDKNFEVFAKKNPAPEILAKSKVQLQAAKNVLMSQQTARFWIDNRERSTKSIIVENNLGDACKAEAEKLTKNEANREAEEDRIATAIVNALNKCDKNDSAGFDFSSLDSLPLAGDKIKWLKKIIADDCDWPYILEVCCNKLEDYVDDETYRKVIIPAIDKANERYYKWQFEAKQK